MQPFPTLSVCAPHELSLGNKIPDALHADNVADEFLHGQKTLQAGVHVAALANVGKPFVDNQEHTQQQQRLAGLRWRLARPRY